MSFFVLFLELKTQHRKNNALYEVKNEEIGVEK